MPTPVAVVEYREADRAQAMLDAARAHPNLELDRISPDLSDEAKIARLSPHRAVILGTRVAQRVLEACPQLGFVHLMSAGFDTFDIPALQARGVVFANSSASIAPAVAEHAITLMLAIKRELVASVACVRGGVWQAVPRRDSMSELAGATVGIVGLGHIGREVARRLVCWNCTLLYADAVAAPPEVEARYGLRRVSLEELLSAADVVTLHVPLNAQTHHLMNAERLRLMRSDAILINTCRGPVVDEAALYRALSEGWIAAAGLDVLEVEPAPPDNPLFALDNVVATPHLGGSSVQRVRRASEFALENVARFFAGETPLSLVRVQ